MLQKRDQQVSFLLAYINRKSTLVLMDKHNQTNSEASVFGVDGVDKKDLFPDTEQARLIASTEQWYERNKGDFPKGGFTLIVPKRRSEALSVESANGLETRNPRYSPV